MTRGIVYVAWGEQHLKEACHSSRANKSGHPTCLLTNEESLSAPLDETFGPGYSLSMLQQHFSQVKVVNLAAFDAPGQSHFWRKQAALLHSPFMNTCYLDSDCFVQGDLSLGFDLAEEGNFCTVIAPQQTFTYAGKEYILSNGGVWFAPTPAPTIVGPLLDLRYYVNISGDEATISVAIRQKLFTHVYLPETYNLCRAGEGQASPIKIFHSRTLHGNPPEFLRYDYYGNRLLSNW